MLCGKLCKSDILLGKYNILYWFCVHPGYPLGRRVNEAIHNAEPRLGRGRGGGQPGLQAHPEGHNGIYQANLASSSRIWILESKKTLPKSEWRDKTRVPVMHSSLHSSLLLFLICIYVWSVSAASASSIDWAQS